METAACIRPAALRAPPPRCRPEVLGDDVMDATPLDENEEWAKVSSEPRCSSSVCVCVCVCVWADRAR